MEGFMYLIETLAWGAKMLACSFGIILAVTALLIPFFIYGERMRKGK